MKSSTNKCILQALLRADVLQANQGLEDMALNFLCQKEYSGGRLMLPKKVGGSKLPFFSRKHLSNSNSFSGDHCPPGTSRFHCRRRYRVIFLKKQMMSAMVKPIRSGVKLFGSAVTTVPETVYGGVVRVGDELNKAAKQVLAVSCIFLKPSFSSAHLSFFRRHRYSC